MKRLFDEYGNLLLAAVGGSFILLIFFSLLADGKLVEAAGLHNLSDERVLRADYVMDDVADFTVSSAVLLRGFSFNQRQYVSAHNTKGEDISMYVVLQQPVDVDMVGKQDVTYVLHYNGRIIAKRAVYVIEQEEVMDSEDDV